MSSLFVRTLREDPADAEVPSHKLLVRAGYIRRAAPGIYTWLPLGLKVLAEGVENEAVAAEVAALGCAEAQGYHYARPMPEEAFVAWLRARQDAP